MTSGTTRNGRAAKLVVIAALLVLAPLAVVALAWLETTVSTSEVTEDSFNEAAELPAEMIDAVTWLPDAPDLPRPMEPLTRLDITDAWLRAWAQLALATETGDTSGLEAYFSSSALDAVETSSRDRTSQPIHQIGHDLRVDFYAEDGQIVGLEATDTRVLRGIAAGSGTGAWFDSSERYEALLVLEDGRWRVHHWVRVDAEGAWWTDPASAAASRPAKRIHGINYYPRDTPWARFWTDYDSRVTDSDLDRIQGLGLDTVRIFLPFAELNGRHVGPSELAPVVDFLDRAEARGLGVIVTLFDGRTDHRPARWDADEAHVTGVFAVLGGHPSIVTWDLKNEPDRDIGIHRLTDDLLHAWLGHVARQVRALDPETPITVGWSTGAAAASAPHHGDIVSFHHYGPPDELPAIVEQLRAVVGARPIWLTEYGLPTWNTLLPGGHTESEQAAYYADIVNLTEELEIEGRLAWTLWDLAVAPPDAGSLPWRTGPQTSLGVLRADGSPKPAAAVLDPAADLAAVDRPGLVALGATKPFRLALLSVVLLVVAARAFSLRVRAVRAD